jgi:hypothetical protein
MRVVRLLPPWLRRGLEAGVIAALVSIVTLLGSASGGSAGRVVLPPGLAGSLVVAPAVLAIGVITVGYPVGYAATRSDAIFGALTAFLIAAWAAALLVTVEVDMAGMGRSISLGVAAGVLALVPALAGFAAGQLITPLGFGRRAGAVTTVVSAGAAIGVLVLASRLG